MRLLRGAAQRFLARSGSQLIEELTAAVASAADLPVARMKPVNSKLSSLYLTQIKTGSAKISRPHFYEAVQRDAENATISGEAGPHPAIEPATAVRALAVAQRVWRPRATSGLQQRPTTVIDRSVGLPSAVVQSRQREQRFAQVWQLVKQQLYARLVHSWCNDTLADTPLDQCGNC